MTKIERSLEITIDTEVPLNIPRPTVTVGDLIDIVNYAFEEGILERWGIEYLDAKRAKLKLHGLEHNYTYSFEINDYYESDNGKVYTINVDTIRKGIELLLSGKTKVSNMIIDDIRENLNNCEISAIDADAVDCVIQAGLYGEILY